MNVIKLDKRYAMTKHGFTHAIEWTNIQKLQYKSAAYKKFYQIHNICRKQFGEQWYRHLGPSGRWYPKREDSKTFARIYFKGEHLITLVQLLL